MANIIIQPTFSGDDRLVFLSRLHTNQLGGAVLTLLDATTFTAYKTGRDLLSRDQRDVQRQNAKLFVLEKWDSRFLGKARAEVQAYLDGLGRSPTRAEARQAVKLQLQAKYHAEIAAGRVDIDADLLPLVTGLVL